MSFQSKKQIATRIAFNISGLAVAVGAWWLATQLIPMPEQFAKGFSPASAFKALIQIVQNGELFHNLIPSLKRILVGLGFAFAVGVPVGVAVGYFWVVRSVTSSVFQFLRMISPLAWMPIAIIIFGIGDKPVYFLIAVAAVWPSIINTAQGVRSVDPGWIRVVRVMGGGQVDVLRRAIMPAVIPDIITGVRISVGISWIILVPAEMLGVTSGLGYFILDARDRFEYGELMACILAIGVVGMLLDFILSQLESRLSWRVDPRIIN